MEQKPNLCYYGIYIIMGLCECGSLKNYKSKKNETKQFIQNHPGYEVFLKHSPMLHICYIHDFSVHYDVSEALLLNTQHARCELQVSVSHAMLLSMTHSAPTHI